jgi:hypothetical protein
MSEGGCVAFPPWGEFERRFQIVVTEIVKCYIATVREDVKKQFEQTCY